MTVSRAAALMCLPEQASLVSMPAEEVPVRILREDHLTF